jgi:hypothetical protein
MAGCMVVRFTSIYHWALNCVPTKGPCYTSYVQMEVKEVYCKVHETAYLLVGTMMKAGGLAP